MGYRLNAFNFLAQKNNYGTRMKGPRNLQISLNADANSKYSHNLVNLTTPHGVAPDPEIVTFQIFKEAILAQGEAFEATHAKAWPSNLSDLWVCGRDAVHLPIAWISYIGPLYSHLVTPPGSAIVERRPDGGLLMAATDETFSVDNPAHMAVARDIAAAVAPFSALPRPLGHGTFDRDGWPIRR